MRRSCKTCGEPSWSPHPPLCLVHRPDEATRQAQAAKGGRAKGGYGQRHKRERARHARLVRAGLAFCVRCHDAILPDEPWDWITRRIGRVGRARRMRAATAGPGRRGAGTPAGRRCGSGVGSGLSRFRPTWS